MAQLANRGILRMAEKKEPAASAGGAGSMRVDTALVQELAELLSANELTEIEVEDGDRKIRVARRGAPVAAPASSVAVPAAPAATTAAAPAEAEDLGNAVKSPMVG